MFAFQLLLVLTALGGILSAGCWVRVSASRSLTMTHALDGTEKIAARANRRALTGALTASGLTVLLAAATWLVGRSAGAL